MKSSIKSALLTFTAGLAVMSMLIGCGGKKTADTKEESETLFAVNTLKTGNGNLDDYLEFGGDVASVNAVDVMPDVAGKIASVKVSVGDMVQKDDIIAFVDASRAGYAYQTSPVKSPIAGRVTSLPVTIGNTVSQAMSIAKVARTDELEVKISIPERFISRIQDRQLASVTFDAYPNEVFSARVTEVSPVLDTMTRTMGVKLRFVKSDSRVKAGMYARVKLVTDSVKNAIVIPSPAIVTRDGESYVYIVSSQKNGDTPAAVRQQKITTGISVDNKTEVTKGLESGDEIVIKGQGLLNDGAKINIISVAQSE